MKQQACHAHYSASCFSYLATLLRDVFIQLTQVHVTSCHDRYSPRWLFHLTSPVVTDGHLGYLLDADVQEKLLLTLLLTLIRVFFSSLQQN